MSRRALPVPAFAVLAAALTLLAAAPAHAQGDLTLRVAAHDDDGDLYFTAQGLDGKNPPIRLRPGMNVTVEFRNEGPNQSHSLHFGDPIGERTETVAPGENRTMRFTVPADATGTGEYWCDLHRQSRMSGEVRFEPPGGLDRDDGGDANGAVDTDREPEPDNDTPGPGAVLALGALALAAARRR